MNVIREKDKIIIQKEQELNRLMEEYYKYDMTELKQEVERLLNQESEKISKEKEQKQREIANNFKRIMCLAQDHIAKGSNYKVNQIDEQQAIEEFEN